MLASGLSGRLAIASQVTRRASFVEQEFQQSLLVLRHAARAPRERHFDRAAARIAQHVGVGLVFRSSVVAWRHASGRPL